MVTRSLARRRVVLYTPAVSFADRIYVHENRSLIYYRTNNFGNTSDYHINSKRDVTAYFEAQNDVFKKIITILLYRNSEINRVLLILYIN